MGRCNANGVDHLSGLTGYGVLAAPAAELSDDLDLHRAGAERMHAIASLA